MYRRTRSSRHDLWVMCETCHQGLAVRSRCGPCQGEIGKRSCSGRGLFFASSVKSVGDSRLRKLAKQVTQGRFSDSDGAKPVRARSASLSNGRRSALASCRWNRSLWNCFVLAPRLRFFAGLVQACDGVDEAGKGAMWPQSWCGEERDVVLGEQIDAALTACMLDLLVQTLTRRTVTCTANRLPTADECVWGLVSQGEQQPRNPQ